MVDLSKFHLWSPDERQLQNLDLVSARNLIVQCFLESQRDAIRATKSRLATESSEQSLRASAEGSLRAAFRRTGGNYDAPTRDSLRRAIEDLAKTSETLGAPAQIIEHHRKVILRVLERLPE